jgi:uncharacterized protein YqgC (DUF456 family)
LPIRIGLVAVGGSLLLAGVAGLFLPLVPGTLLIVSGLAVLAGEFVWAGRILDRTRRRLAVMRREAPDEGT